MDYHGFLAFQGCDGFLQGCNFLKRVALLLALHGNNCLGGMSHKLLGAELLAHGGKEAFEMLELCLGLLNLGCHVDHLAKWYGILGGAHHERRCCRVFLAHYLNG